ncbi:MAG: sensor histidine kinase [Arhodomonas sp.]|nr:sensor histidine kinase [Arhodomonas sp.]
MTERVSDNLIDNALTHAPTGGTVSLRARVAGQRVEITVADDGPGVPEEARSHLFEPFTRGDEREVKGHAGLGLAIAKRMMELQGGGLALQDREPSGAEFMVTLPLARAGSSDVMES